MPGTQDNIVWSIINMIENSTNFDRCYFGLYYEHTQNYVWKIYLKNGVGMLTACPAPVVQAHDVFPSLSKNWIIFQISKWFSEINAC